MLDVYGGVVLDCYIIEDCGVINKFSRGMVVLVGWSFNV